MNALLYGVIVKEITVLQSKMWERVKKVYQITQKLLICNVTNNNYLYYNSIIE